MVASQPRSTQALHGILLRCLAIFFFALMSAAMKWASEGGAGLVELVFFRSAVGLPVTAAWLAMGPGIAVVRTRRPASHLLRSMVGMLSLTMLYQALMLLPIADAVTIGFSSPAFATLLSVLILHEKVGPYRWAAVLIGFIGVLIVTQPSGTGLPTAGIVYALIGAASSAAATILIREMSGSESHGAIVFWFFVSSTVISGVAMLFHSTALPPLTWGLLVFGGVTGAAAQLLMTRALQVAPVSVVAPFDYTQIIWAALLGWLIWSTLPGPSTLFGAGLIVVSGLTTAWREHRLNKNRIAATPPIE
ncbi:MAG: DMT family transporter [Pseudomonadota bacterium]